MRWYGMYYVCKNYIDVITGIKVSVRETSKGQVNYLDGWKRIKRYLNELQKVPVLKKYVDGIYASIPEVFMARNKFDIDASVVHDFTDAKKRLCDMMRNVIEIYETMSPDRKENEESGFDIRLPEFRDLKEFGQCMEDLDFIITKCPYLRVENSEIKYGQVDIGSFWITFLVSGSAAAIVLSNLANIVDKVMKIRSHNQTVKMQKEEVRKAKLKNYALEKMLANLDEVEETIKKSYIDELEEDIHSLENGEERDVAGRSMDRLLFWMDKGLEIYSAIESPREIKDLFPEQKEMALLSDDVVKLLEMKE